MGLVRLLPFRYLKFDKEAISDGCSSESAPHRWRGLEVLVILER